VPHKQTQAADEPSGRELRRTVPPAGCGFDDQPLAGASEAPASPPPPDEPPWGQPASVGALQPLTGRTGPHGFGKTSHVSPTVKHSPDVRQS
jgi:hypothetical protein